MKKTFVRPRWSNADHTAILCTVMSLTYGKIAFQAMPTDPEAKGRQIYADWTSGKRGDIAPYQPDSQESS
jgi:hypothetical protein